MSNPWWGRLKEEKCKVYQAGDLDFYMASVAASFQGT